MQEVNYIPISPSKKGGASRVHNKKNNAIKHNKNLQKKRTKYKTNGLQLTVIVILD